jgi:hypothetical protein
MIEGCKTLVRYFKKTGLNRNLPKTLKQEVSTRFNSIYTMLSSVEAVFDEVIVILTRNDNLNLLSSIKRKSLQAVTKQLQRFDEATRKLAVEREETIHFEIHVPVLHELNTKLMKEHNKYRDAGESKLSVLCRELAKGVSDKYLSKVTCIIVLLPFCIRHFYIILQCCLERLKQFKFVQTRK